MNKLLKISGKLLIVCTTLIFIFTYDSKTIAAPAAPPVYSLWCVAPGNTGSGSGQGYCEWYTSSSACTAMEGVTCSGPFPNAPSCVATCPF